MRKVFLVMLLAVATNSATAEWVEIGGNETITTYADPATISKTGDIVRMWSVGDRKTPHDRYMSIREQYEYDCKEERVRRLDTLFHSGNMGEGAVVYANSDPLNWRPVGPRTIAGSLWIFACSKR